MSTISAFVEIVFDNTDQRFPTGRPELNLRRTIGLKKDEYSLDKKSATKAEVMNLLEAAGFSRSNPYYIVPQGRITSLTNMRPHERLQLLKEVAGTKVYEQRRKDSLTLMNETSEKRAKIQDTLDNIQSRLNELEGEKAELKDYQKEDLKRRALESCIYQHELEDANQALETLLRDWEGVDQENMERQKEFQKRQQEIIVRRSMLDLHITLCTHTNA